MAAQVSDNEEAGSPDDRGNLGHRAAGNAAVARVLRPSAHLQGRPGAEALPGDVAAAGRRRPLLPRRQPHALLRRPHDPHFLMLRPHLYQGVAAPYPQRHQGRPDGAAPAEVEGQGRQDAHRRRHSLRALLAAALRHFHAHQARRWVSDAYFIKLYQILSRLFARALLFYRYMWKDTFFNYPACIFS